MIPEEHFATKAKEYDQKRSKGIQGWLVNKEKTCVLKSLQIEKEEKILDAGSGSGYYSLLIKKAGGNPYGVDFSAEMIKQLKARGIQGEVADLENFNLQRKFDKILCAGALEFLKNPELAVKNFNKHLKTNGVLIILYPRISIGGIIYKSYHILHGIKIRLFTRSEIKGIVEKNGFKVLNQETANMNCAVLKAVKQQDL